MMYIGIQHYMMDVNTNISDLGDNFQEKTCHQFTFSSLQDQNTSCLQQLLQTKNTIHQPTRTAEYNIT